MFNPDTIKTAFASLVTWRQNSDSGGLQLDPAPAGSSDSGLYHQDVSPYVTLNNIAATIQDFARTEASSTLANQAFTSYVNRITGEAAVMMVLDWLALKSDVYTVSNIQDRKQLFMGSGRDFEADVDNGELVGIEIAMRGHRGLQRKIKGIGLQLTAAQPLTVYLFSRQQRDPVQSQVITVAKEKEVTWQAVDWTLKAEDGPFYLVYHQDDLTGQSINGIYAHNYWQSRTHYPAGRFFAPRAFSSPSGTTSEIWDATSHKYTLSTNYGLNLRFSTHCDYTDFIVEQKNLFQQAYHLAVGVKVLELLTAKPSARNQRNVVNIDRDYVTYLLYGDGKANGGLRRRYERALKTISLNNDSGLDPVCLPCVAGAGIEFTAT